MVSIELRVYILLTILGAYLVPATIERDCTEVQFFLFSLGIYGATAEYNHLLRWRSAGPLIFARQNFQKKLFKHICVQTVFLVGTVGLEPTFRRTRPLNVRVCQFRHIPKTLNIISNIFSKCNNNLQFFQFNFKIFCFSLDTINFVCYNHNVFVCTQIADYLNPETFGIVETKTAIFHKYFGELPRG